MENLEQRLNPLADLTAIEEHLLKQTARGLSAKEIACQTGKSVNTVSHQIYDMKKKIGATKNTELCLSYFSRKFKIPISVIISCALLLMAFRPTTCDLRRCYRRPRIEESRTYRPYRRQEDAMY